MPEVKHETSPALHALSSGSVYRRGADGGYTSGTTDVATTLLPASRMRAMSATASSGRRSPVAVYETQSAPRARISSGSVVAVTPTGGRPASSPASLPALSGLWTRTPASSRSGCWTMPWSASRPTLPVLHCATRYAMAASHSRHGSPGKRGRPALTNGRRPFKAQETAPEPRRHLVDRFAQRARDDAGADDHAALEDQGALGDRRPAARRMRLGEEPRACPAHRPGRSSARVAHPVEGVDPVDRSHGAVDDLRDARADGELAHGCDPGRAPTGWRVGRADRTGTGALRVRPTRVAVSSPTTRTTLASTMKANVVRESVPAVTPWIVARAKSGKLA